MKIGNASFGFVFLVFACLIFWGSSALPNIPGQDVGPAAFPSVLAVLLAGCGVILMVQGVQTTGMNAFSISFLPWMRSWPHVRNVVLVIVSLIFYVVASDDLGFFACALIIMTSLFLSLSVNWWMAIVVAVGATLVIHFIFYKGLQVPLPWGFLPVLW